MKLKKRYKQYSREFKVEAVRLSEVGDKTASEVARELGVRVNQIWKWKQQLEREAATGVAAKRGRPSDDEVARLRRENAQLKEENELLKKAAIFFARESK
jgi:transposase-like protein